MESLDMLRDFENPMPGKFFESMKLEEIQSDSVLADIPIRTFMLPLQITRLLPDNTNNDAPVAGCKTISMGKGVFGGATKDAEDSDIWIAIVRVNFIFILIPGQILTSIMLSDNQFVISATDNRSLMRPDLLIVPKPLVKKSWTPTDPVDKKLGLAVLLNSVNGWNEGTLKV